MMDLRGSKVLLRALEREDLEYLREMANDPDMEKMVIGWSFPISKYEQEKWYEKTVGDKTNLKLAIQDDKGVLIGMATLGPIDWKNRKAEHGIKLGRNTPKGQGYATDAVMTVMKYAFEELQLNRLEGSMFEYNIASQKLYTKCGWSVEGKARQSIYKNNKYHDEIIVSVLREDYYTLMGISNGNS